MLVQRLRKCYGLMRMVGAGLNDAETPASADVGIAPGTRGSDVALEAADVVLMSNSVGQVRLVIRQKIAFALQMKGLHVGDADCGRQRRHSASDLQRLESFLRTRSILPNGPLKCLATLLTHGSCA